MARAAQLNIRMNPQVKAAGDSVLDLYGISPTEIVRALWQKISLGEVALVQVLQAFAATPAVGSARPQDEGRMSEGLAQMVLARQADFEREMGLDLATYVALSDEELDDIVYQDWLEEEGVAHDVQPADSSD